MSVPDWPRDDPDLPAIRGAAARARIALRGAALVIVLAVLLPAHLLVRGIERLTGAARWPVSTHIVQGFFRASLAIMGIGLRIRGQPMSRPGAVVANHASWLDIFVLNAGHRVVFVSKSEVAGWPGIGFLARAAGTVFIRRDARDAQAQTRALEARLRVGQQLLFFPEGTSTDGLRVLRFKPTLFQALLSPSLKSAIWIQPVTVIYHAPAGADPAFHGWFGDMDFAPHMLMLMAAPRGGWAELVYHAPLGAADFADRKALAATAERTIRAAMPPERQRLPG